MKPISGKYYGTVFMNGGTKGCKVTVTLIAEDSGRLTGHFRVHESEENWTGPRKGPFNEGGWSPFGTLHLEEDEEGEAKGEGTFDGTFTASDGRLTVISTTIYVTKVNTEGKEVVTQTGTMALISAEAVEVGTTPIVTDDGEGPWSS